MIKKIDLNKQSLKAFLYNFFVVWNLLVIILLIFLNIYVSSYKSKKIIPGKEIPQEWGQFKLKWKSYNKYQDIGKNLFSIAIADLNKDKINDIIVLSSDGVLSALNGKNGYTLFKLNLSPSTTHLKLVAGEFPKIIVGSTNARVLCISHTGKELWKIKAPAKIIATGVSKKQNGFNIIAGFLEGVAFIDLLKGKIKHYNTSFGSRLFSEIITYDFNNDKTDDTIVGDTQSIYCIDGITGNILWQRKVDYLYAGRFSLINDENNDLYLIVPLYNGKILILNRAGAEVWGTDINERLVDAPITFKNKKEQACFVQSTVQGTIICFNFEKREKLWVRAGNTNSAVKMGMVDLNYDDVPELITVDKYGKLNIIRSDNGNTIDTLSILENTQDENIVSNIVIDDINNDGNFEIAVASNNGNVYVYTYIMFKKRKFWKLILNKKSRWRLYGGNINGNFRFN